MNADQRVHPVLALAAGYLFGVGCVYAGLWAITGSSSAAITFSLIPALFFLPVVIVFIIASARSSAAGLEQGNAERRQPDVVVAVCYVFALIPFWFAAVAFLEGRLALGSVLLAVYALMAAAPLRCLLRMRTAHAASHGSQRD
jgi:hypothetical protein